jgi:predicted AlkP superfamily pyrophosphatase or phosphodiesterase
MRRSLALFAAGCALAGCATAPTPSTPAERPPAEAFASRPAPKLIVAISVDQFSADLFDEYRPQFTGGLARIASGAAFHNGYQSHAWTETCPGHSTILTGAHPARTGIVANNWIDQSIARKEKSVYCAEDERLPPPNPSAPQGTLGSFVVSPAHLMVPTLGELLKQVRPGSRNVAVSGKDRAAVMMTGRNVDQRWYWDGAKFASDLSAPVPQAVTRANAAVKAAILKARPPLEPPPFCQAKARSIQLQGSTRTVGNGRFARNPEDARAFRASPELDGATLALAAALVDEMQLGKRSDPDVLAVSLSATDFVGHSYGTEGEEMCLQLLSLDRDLGDFLSVLDSLGLDYMVLLTADHGGLDIPERARLAGVGDAARIEANLNAGAIGLQLARRLGIQGSGLLGDGAGGDVYVDRTLPKADRERLMQAAISTYRAHPQVEAVFTAGEIAATKMPTGSPDKWSLIQRARASYYPGRSGDFLVILKKNITPIPETSRYAATHGSAWDYDRRVPILFWRPGMGRSPSERAVDTVDILPTLGSVLGLRIDPAAIDGRCLRIEGASC